MIQYMENSLVSVCVITYNSSQTVLNTLKSIKEQTYKNIELIVSDDSSNDNTIEIVDEWLKNNKERFSRVKLIRTDKNTGVTGNENRAVKECQGEFIKTIGADDILLKDYVSECVKYFEKNPTSQLLFTKLKLVDKDGNELLDNKVNYDFFNLNSKEQFKYIIKHHLPFLPTPSSIYKKDIFEKFGYFDERIPMWEDGPMYFRLIKNGISFHLLDKELVLYTILETSLSNSVPFRHRRSIAQFFFLYLFRYEIKQNFIKAIYHCFKFLLMYFSNYKLCNYMLNTFF